jgi:flagellar hook-basal body complex protein FliE
MSIEAISPMGVTPFAADVAAADRVSAAQLSGAQLSGAQATGLDFATMIGDGLGRVDESLRAADGQIRSLAAGENIPLHDVMITMERARMDLMLVVEVRNRLVEAYQELTRMQL